MRPPHGPRPPSPPPRVTQGRGKDSRPRMALAIARRVRIAHRYCPIGARCVPYGIPQAGVGAVAQGQRGKPVQTPRGHWISDHRYTQQDSARERRRMEFMKGNYLIIIDEGGNP